MKYQKRIRAEDAGYVALRGRAWIEIGDSAAGQLLNDGRPPREGVD